jgi:perosamine synthetase
MTYISTANVVLLCGATPALCECNPRTYNTEPEHVRAKISPRTKAFITVDMKGMAVDYDAFAALARETSVPFLADSAESLGAEYKGAKIGPQALAHSFSFYANKNITTGEGGMVVTNDGALADTLRILRNQGQEGRYNHTWLGHNYRMTDVAAAIGIEQLRRAEWLLTEKSRLAGRYDAAFAALAGVEPPLVAPHATRHSWYMYSIRVAPDIRDALVRHLNDRGIDTRLSFPPVHIQPYYRDRFGYAPEDLPLTLRAFRSFIDIPCWVGMTAAQQDRVIASVRDFLNNAG